MSRSGWAVVDDSPSAGLQRGGLAGCRGDSLGNLDLYFFGYGHDYLGCLRDFCAVAGQTPLIPRWIAGQLVEPLLGLLRRTSCCGADGASSRRTSVPLSVCIIDMDWHITETGNASHRLDRLHLEPRPVPRPARLHRLAARAGPQAPRSTCTRPRASTRTRRSIPSMAAAHGHRPGHPASRCPSTSPTRPSRRAYFELLHHPHGGSRAWTSGGWTGSRAKQQPSCAGPRPAVVAEPPALLRSRPRRRKRPFIFSRWGGLGNHRYPIGFSGDTVVDLGVAGLPAHFTATAANVGYGWWSHDIGGHMGGIEDAELYARWVQYGVFSPILRLHSTNNPYHERRPWGCDGASVPRRARRHAAAPRADPLPLQHGLAHHADEHRR